MSSCDDMVFIQNNCSTEVSALSIKKLKKTLLHVQACWSAIHKSNVILYIRLVPIILLIVTDISMVDSNDVKRGSLSMYKLFMSNTMENSDACMSGT